jgi:type IV pilus assembly protein PilF
LYDHRGELTRAQFYIRRLNNSNLANAETLWLGIKIEQRLKFNREGSRPSLATTAEKTLWSVARSASA